MRTCWQNSRRGLHQAVPNDERRVAPGPQDPAYTFSRGCVNPGSTGDPRPTPSHVAESATTLLRFRSRGRGRIPRFSQGGRRFDLGEGTLWRAAVCRDSIAGRRPTCRIDSYGMETFTGCSLMGRHIPRPDARVVNHCICGITPRHDD